MTDITTMGTVVLTEEEQAARELHLRIKTSMELAANYLLEFCRDLKEMRDTEQYRTLGYERFEDYTEEAVGIKSRQAYYYISTYEKLGPELLEEKAALGITKLRLLSEVAPLDREEFLEDNDLGGMTAEEIRAAIRERDGLREQLSMIEAAPAGREEPGDDGEAERLRAQLEEAQAEISTLRDNQPDVESIRTQVLDEYGDETKAAVAEEVWAEMEKEMKKAVSEAKREAKEKAEKAQEKVLEDTRAAALEEGREAAKREMDVQLEVLRQEKEAAAAREAAVAARAAELEKQLNLTASTETTAFTLHFDALQQAFIKCTETAAALEEKEMAEAAEKMRMALRKGMEALLGQI